MNPVLLTPWRAGDPDREINLYTVLSHYGQTGIRHVFADADTPAFSRTAARNRAANDAGASWDVAAFIDADCIIPLAALVEALTEARYSGKVVLPHDRFYPLSRSGSETARFEPDISRWDPYWVADPWIARKRPSGVIVFPREAWEAVGGYDERFAGWGFEDTAMLWAIEDVALGWTRLPGPLWHLWHPEQAATWRPEDKALFERYKMAHGHVGAMKSLLDERLEARLRV